MSHDFRTTLEHQTPESNKSAGGKVLNTKTRRSANRAAAIFRLSAMHVGQTQTALGAFYRR